MALRYKRFHAQLILNEFRAFCRGFLVTNIFLLEYLNSFNIKIWVQSQLSIKNSSDTGTEQYHIPIFSVAFTLNEPENYRFFYVPSAWMSHSDKKSLDRLYCKKNMRTAVIPAGTWRWNNAVVTSMRRHVPAGNLLKLLIKTQSRIISSCSCYRLWSESLWKWRNLTSQQLFMHVQLSIFPSWWPVQM